MKRPKCQPGKRLEVMVLTVQHPTLSPLSGWKTSRRPRLRTTAMASQWWQLHLQVWKPGGNGCRQIVKNAYRNIKTKERKCWRNLGSQLTNLEKIKWEIIWVYFICFNKQHLSHLQSLKKSVSHTCLVFPTFWRHHPTSGTIPNHFVSTVLLKLGTSHLGG